MRFDRVALLDAFAATRSSTNVFHAPHEGHLPCHLGESAPHSEQNHMLFVFVAIIVGNYLLRNSDKVIAVAIATFRDSDVVSLEG